MGRTPALSHIINSEKSAFYMGTPSSVWQDGCRWEAWHEVQKQQTALITIWTFTVLKQWMTSVSTLQLLKLQKTNRSDHMDWEFEGIQGSALSPLWWLGAILFSSRVLNEMPAILCTRQLFHQPSSETLSYMGDFRKKSIFIVETHYVGLLFM